MMIMPIKRDRDDTIHYTDVYGRWCNLVAIIISPPPSLPTPSTHTHTIYQYSLNTITTTRATFIRDNEEESNETIV